MKLNRAVFFIGVLFVVANSLGARSQEILDSKTFDRWMSELSNWGRWGSDDELGTVNLITPAKRVEAARLVSKGVSVPLGRVVLKTDGPDNPYPFDHEMEITGLDATAVLSEDSYSVRYHGTVHTHLDALCHIFYRGKIYNGLAQNLVTETGCPKLSIGALGQGIFTRGVLVDIAWLRGVPYLEPGSVILPSDLDAWTERTGVEIRPGDAVLIRTGRWARRDEKGAWSVSEGLAGLHVPSVKWLKDRDVGVVGTDAVADVIPNRVEGVRMPVHKLLIVAAGTPIFDNLDLEGLSREAKRQNRWEFLFTAAPLRVPAGTGSPLNPVATF